MNASPPRTSSDRSALDESGVDVRRYLTALRRSRGLIAAIVIGLTGTVLALSLLLPKTYKASSTVVLDVQEGALGTEDPGSQERRLNTANSLMLSRDVVERAAEDVPGENADSITDQVESVVDTDANLIYIEATNNDPQTAAAVANAVANSFLDVQAERDVQSINDAIDRISEQIAALEGDPGAADQVAALREQRTNLEVEVATQNEFDLAEEATAPSDPASPRPQRNTVLALFASVFLAVLVALGRDQLRPRLSEPRELSQVLGTPVLAGIPFVGRRFGRRNRLEATVEHEAYQTLRAAFELGAPPDSRQVILVTSAVHGEGKTTVTARLGRALAQAGHRTLLVSADLRWPDLHTLFSLPVEPGLSDVLSLTERAGVSQHLLPATAHEIAVRGAEAVGGRLDVLTSGRKPGDPARLLSSPATHSFFDYVRGFDYDYVLIDAPPMLGIADAQSLAREADRVVVVVRLERLTADHVFDLRDLIERVKMDPLGLVVIGAKVEVSPYYLSERPSLFRDVAGEEEEREGAESTFG